MNRNKEKPYLEFGGNAFYVNLDAILDVIKIESSNQTIEKIVSEKTEIKPKNSRKKKEELIESQEIVNPESGEIIFEQNQGIQVDISKWEVLRMMMEVIMTNSTEVDDKLGMAGLNNGTTIPFKIAFNTLLKYNILQEEE